MKTGIKPLAVENLFIAPKVCPKNSGQESGGIASAGLTTKFQSLQPKKPKAVLVHQLELSEAFSKGVLNAITSQLAVIAIDGCIVAVNKAWQEFGKANGLTDFHGAEVGANYLAVCQQAVKANVVGADEIHQGILAVLNKALEDFYFEYPCHSPTEKRWFSMQVSRFDHDGVKAVIKHTNITESKIASATILETRILLTEAQKLARRGSWNYDAILNELFYSEGLRKIYGLPLHGLISVESSTEIIHPDDCERVLNEVFYARVGDAPIENTFRIVKANTKEVRTIKGITVAKFNNDGALLRIFGTAEDVTELHKAEEERDLLLLQLEQRVLDRTCDLAQKNKDINDSIVYAKRIQNGILSPFSELKSIFPKAFVLSMPRDVVSGDFFWCYAAHNKKYIVVADCTGHGVPGALMSIIGNNLLNQIIIEEGQDNPSLILQELDKRLKFALRTDQSEVMDGMDLVLCMVDQHFYELCYAGALRPLFMTNAEGVIQELSPNKQSIGGANTEHEKCFNTQRFPIAPKQRIYLTSDGYYAQFGGPQDKKFMKMRFITTLQGCQNKTMATQRGVLLAAINEWQGANDQVDDILVVGIEL